MFQEISPGNARLKSHEKAILERLSYSNLTLDDLIATKAFAELVKSDSFIMNAIADATLLLERKSPLQKSV